MYNEETTIAPFRDETGKMVLYVCTGRDVKQKIRSEEYSESLSYYDSLTRLPNRGLFTELLKSAMARAARHQKRLALLYIDLDDFKTVNDRLGHSAGDELLKLAGYRLKQCVRTVDIVSRLSGDEFAILLEDLNRPEQAICILNKIMVAFEQPFVIRNKQLEIYPSIGVSFYPRDSLDERSLLSKADTALYHAKSEGKKRYYFYKPGVNR
jgi:diguanylate cyclase (GGDEF)-like protein